MGDLLGSPRVAPLFLIIFSFLAYSFALYSNKSNCSGTRRREDSVGHRSRGKKLRRNPSELPIGSAPGMDGLSVSKCCADFLYIFSFLLRVQRAFTIGGVFCDLDTTERGK